MQNWSIITVARFHYAISTLRLSGSVIFVVTLHSFIFYIIELVMLSMYSNNKQFSCVLCTETTRIVSCTRKQCVIVSPRGSHLPQEN